MTGVDQSERMDRLYRWQRHFYDLSRRFILPGRNALLRRMEIADGDHVLEVGCGTARNLIALAKTHRRAKFYGLDASRKMLQTAEVRVRRSRPASPIVLELGLAENLDPGRLFGLEHPFDLILFSYSLSMIIGWREAIDGALASLRPGGSMFIVDFGDQRGVPSPLRKLVARWLTLFDVKYRPEVLEYLKDLARKGRGRLGVEPLCGSYFFLACFELA